MRLDDQPESSNIDDQRGAGGGFGGGGGPGIVRLGGLGGFGLVAVLVISLVFGVNPLTLLSVLEGQQGGSQPQQQTPAPARDPSQAGAEDSQRRFVAQVLGSTEGVWTDVFQQSGRRYEPPTLVLFSGATRSACGTAQSSTGPFYCPLDHQVYLDTAFFREMQSRLGAPGDFPRAYVIAHEIGHHVQTLLGIIDMREAGRSNDTSVRTELQADCFAGVWANRANATNHILDQGDIEQGINAAAAIGDDRLQQRSRGYAVPDSFTHGSSAQRVRWFGRGVQSGDPRQCDTFHADAL